MKRFNLLTHVLILSLFLFTLSCESNKDMENPAYMVSSFNLRMDTPNDSLNSWSHRKNMVNDLLVYHDIDIVGTQEGFHHQLEDIKRIPYFEYVGIGRDDGGTKGEYSAIFYNKDKFEALENGDFWYSETPDIPGLGWDATCCNRICSWVKLKDKKTRTEFIVFNSHFDHQGVKAREESAKLLLKKVAEIAGGLPTIITGDLNSLPETMQVKLISEKFNDAYKVSKNPPYGPVGTFNSFNWHAPFKNRIDYIFVSDAIEVLKYATLMDALEMRFPSDHLPVVAQLRIKKAK